MSAGRYNSARQAHWREVALGAALLLAAAAAVADAPLRDPTVPTRPRQFADSPRDNAARWRLSSTLVGPHRRLAIINGTTVGQGQRFGGARVVAIGDGVVRMEHHGKVVVLHLLPGGAIRKQRSRIEP